MESPTSQRYPCWPQWFYHPRSTGWCGWSGRWPHLWPHAPCPSRTRVVLLLTRFGWIWVADADRQNALYGDGRRGHESHCGIQPCGTDIVGSRRTGRRLGRRLPMARAGHMHSGAVRAECTKRRPVPAECWFTIAVVATATPLRPGLGAACDPTGKLRAVADRVDTALQHRAAAMPRASTSTGPCGGPPPRLRHRCRTHEPIHGPAEDLCARSSNVAYGCRARLAAAMRDARPGGPVVARTTRVVGTVTAAERPSATVSVASSSSSTNRAAIAPCSRTG